MKALGLLLRYWKGGPKARIMEYMEHRSKKGLFEEGQWARERRVGGMVNGSGEWRKMAKQKCHLIKETAESTLLLSRLANFIF